MKSEKPVSGTIEHFERYCDKGGDPMEYASIFKVPHCRVDEFREKRMRDVSIAILRAFTCDQTEDDALPALLPKPKKWNSSEEKERFVERIQLII